MPVDVTSRYRFIPGVDLRLTADRGTSRHFAAEYAGAEVADDGSAPALDVRFGPATSDGPRIVGGHKTAKWSVTAPAPAGGPLRAEIELRGQPRFFGRSLVQGYFVEPLLSVAVARAGHVLLPSAAIGEDGGALVIMGGSGTGKSSLSARALAAGRPVLGDDQILLDGDGDCRRFPRRMRFYSDLPQTAPAAYARLPAEARLQLQARSAAKVLSRGFIRPSLAVAPTKIAAGGETRGPLALRRLVLLERSPAAPALHAEPSDLETAVNYGLRLLDEQRTRLQAGAGAAWEAELSDVREQERRTLAAALAGIAVTHVAVPGSWPAPQAITALADYLGTER